MWNLSFIIHWKNKVTVIVWFISLTCLTVDQQRGTDLLQAMVSLHDRAPNTHIITEGYTLCQEIYICILWYSKLQVACYSNNLRSDSIYTSYEVLDLKFYSQFTSKSLEVQAMVYMYLFKSIRTLSRHWPHISYTAVLDLSWLPLSVSQECSPHHPSSHHQEQGLVSTCEIWFLENTIQLRQLATYIPWFNVRLHVADHH